MKSNQFLKGLMASNTLPTSPLFALRRLESHPPSSENPIACIVFKAASTLSSFSLSFMSSPLVYVFEHIFSAVSFPSLFSGWLGLVFHKRVCSSEGRVG